MTPDDRYCVKRSRPKNPVSPFALFFVFLSRLLFKSVGDFEPMEPIKPTDRPIPRGAPAPPISEPPRTFANVVQPKAKSAVVERPPEVAIQSSYRQNPTAPKPMEPEKPSSDPTGTGSFSAPRVRSSATRSDEVTPSPDRKAAPQPTSPVFQAVTSSSPHGVVGQLSTSSDGIPIAALAVASPVRSAQEPAGSASPPSEPAAPLASPPSQVRSVKSNVTPVRSVRVSSEEQAPSEPRAR